MSNEKIFIKTFNNIPHFIKTIFMSTFFKDGCDVYHDKVLIDKQDSITPITDHMIPVDFCQNKNL